MRIRLIYILLINVFFTGTISSQVGGFGVFKFLNLSPSARMTALGDHLVSIYDDDINMALENPSLLNDKMTKHISLSHKFHFAGIKSGYASYALNVKKLNMPFHVGVQYISYGEEAMTDLYGDNIGTVEGGEYAFIVGASREVYEKLRIGINTKFITSKLGPYSSTGISMDLASTYFIPNKNITIGFVIRNIGTQITKYGEEREYTQRNVLFGFTKRLQHLPFRLTITAHHLNRWNLLYDDPNGENNLFSTDSQERSKISLWSDNFFRHLNFGGEFLLGKNGGPFRLRFGYNVMRAKEMTVFPYRSFAGFSFGIGLKIKRFRIDYAYSVQHLIGGKAHITLSANLAKYKKRL